MGGSDEVTTIPRARQIFYDTYANLPTTNLKIGDLGYATDRLVLYRWSGAAWQALTIHSSSGTAANIPTAGNLPNGSFYYETDTLKTKQIQAGSWVEINAPATAVVTGSYSGNETSRDITTGFKCSLVIILCYSGTDYASIIMPNVCLQWGTGGSHVYNAPPQLHASDGFTLLNSSDEIRMNKNTYTYYYWAISE